LLQILQSSNVVGTSRPDPVALNLNMSQWSSNVTVRASYLRAYWPYQNDQLAFDVPIGFFMCMGLAGLSYCVLCLKKVFKKYKRGRSDLPDMMLLCFVFGCLMTAYEFLANIGSEATVAVFASFITNANDDSFLDQTSTAMMSSSILNTGRKIFIFALLFLFLSIGVLLAAIMGKTTGMLSKRHSHLGFVTSVFGFLTFVTEIALIGALYFGISNGNEEVFYPFLATEVCFGLILMPIWTIWLGVELARLKEEYVFKRDDDVALTGGEAGVGGEDQQRPY